MAGRLKHLELCEEKYEEALKVYSKECPALAKIAFTLGDAYIDVGSIRQGQFYLEGALRAEEAHTKEAPGLYAEALESLSYVYSMIEEGQKERQTLERAMQLYELAGQRLAQAWVMVLLADSLARAGDVKKQVAALRSVVVSLEGLQEGEPLRKVVSCILAALPSGRRDKASAEEEAVGRYFLRFAVAGAADHAGGRRTSGRDLALAKVLERLGPELADKRTPEIQKIQAIVEALRKAQGDESINTAQALVALADMHGERDERRLKLETLKGVLRLQERTFGLDAIYLAWTLKGLGHAYSLLGETEKRLEVLRRALEMQEEEFGANHPHTTTTRYYVQMAQAEARQLIDHDGVRELDGLFGRTLPSNPKVNRFAGEVILSEGLRPVQPLPDRSLAPFPIESTGGGSCAWGPGGLDVPFYAPSALAA